MGRAALVLLVLVGIACSDDGQSRPDGSIDGSKLDVSDAADARHPVSGCASYEQAGACGPDAGAVPCCTGRPPLALSFSPVGSQDLTRFLWTFGDDTPTSTDRAPTHTYAHPGTYQVMLVGGRRTAAPSCPPRCTWWSSGWRRERLATSMTSAMTISRACARREAAAPRRSRAASARRRATRAPAAPARCAPRPPSLRHPTPGPARGRRSVSPSCQTRRGVCPGVRLPDAAHGRGDGGHAVDARVSPARSGARPRRALSRRQRSSRRRCLHDRRLRGRRRARRVQRDLRRRSRPVPTAPPARCWRTDSGSACSAASRTATAARSAAWPACRRRR